MTSLHMNIQSEVTYKQRLEIIAREIKIKKVRKNNLAAIVMIFAYKTGNREIKINPVYPAELLKLPIRGKPMARNKQNSWLQTEMNNTVATGKTF